MEPQNPWWKSPLVQWAAGLALSFVLGFLARYGVVPQPIPEIPALTKKVDELKEEVASLKQQQQVAGQPAK